MKHHQVKKEKQKKYAASKVMSNHQVDNSVNWDAIIKSHKGVITSDNKRTGTVIAQTEDDIVIFCGVIKSHQFIMPESKVDYYDGSDVYLKIPSQLLSIFEVGNRYCYKSNKRCTSGLS